METNVKISMKHSCIFERSNHYNLVCNLIISSILRVVCLPVRYLFLHLESKCDKWLFILDFSLCSVPLHIPYMQCSKYHQSILELVLLLVHLQTCALTYISIQSGIYSIYSFDIYSNAKDQKKYMYDM